MVGFYARFIPDYAKMAAVFHGLMKKGLSFDCGSEHQAVLSL
jgi:hypothetical protein